ncbi:MAG: ATP-binding protein [Gammaproteobacteria bacterium]|nr:ATP-binding protein [Gammaproteobacteria bacterium]
MFINGARQTGKSTLVEHLLTNKYSSNYISLDELSNLAAAARDPVNFINNLSDPVTIDEIQRVPELFLPIKKIVDTKNKKGMFVLTGSANILTIPKISDSLAGRMIIHTLWPLSQGEINGQKENFIDLSFSGSPFSQPKNKLSFAELNAMLLAGGYPRSLNINDVKGRNNWFNSYVDAILQRDVKELANIEKLTELPYLLNIIAGRVANLSNLSDLGRVLKISHTTLKRYYMLLKMIFFVVELSPWSTSREKTLIKTPKVFLNDTGLLCHLLRYDDTTFVLDRSKLGPVLENFVVMELIKQKAWSDNQPDIYHFRTQAGREVDVVLEGRNKRIVGIEVKAASSVKYEDFSGLEKLAEVSADNFATGIVLYLGKQIIPFGKKLFAVPLSCLFEEN